MNLWEYIERRQGLQSVRDSLVVGECDSATPLCVTLCKVLREGLDDDAAANKAGGARQSAP